MKRLLLAFLLLGVSLFVGCGSGSGGSTPPPTVTLVSIAVTPASPVDCGRSHPAIQRNRYLQRRQHQGSDFYRQLAFVVALGGHRQYLRSGNRRGRRNHHHLGQLGRHRRQHDSDRPAPVALVSIAVTPPTATVAPGGQQGFIATGTYSDQSTKVLTSGVTWSASAVRQHQSQPDWQSEQRRARPRLSRPRYGTISGTATLTVTNPLVSIAVTPPTASVAPNATQQFTATGTYADHSTQNITNSVTWSASAGATITRAGLATGVTPNATSTIMAAQGNISGTATLTITNPLVSIAVTPPSPSIAQQHEAAVRGDRYLCRQQHQRDHPTVTWASSESSRCHHQ